MLASVAGAALVVTSRGAGEPLADRREEGEWRPGRSRLGGARWASGQRPPRGRRLFHSAHESRNAMTTSHKNETATRSVSFQQVRRLIQGQRLSQLAHNP